MTLHNAMCRKYSASCLCLTCARDNYRDKTYRQCCLEHGRPCGSTSGWKDYAREEAKAAPEDGRVSMEVINER